MGLPRIVWMLPCSCGLANTAHVTIKPRCNRCNGTGWLPLPGVTR